jgi:hypothetical protein
MPRVNRRLAPSFALALFALWARAGRADEGRWLDLSWQAPPECPPGAEIEREITRLVGSSPKVKGPLRAVVEVTGAGTAPWRARVRTDYAGELGDRTIEGATCRAVAKAVALVISLTIDSNAGKIDTLPPPRREIEQPPPPPPVFPETPPPMPLRGFVAFGPRSELGILTNPGFGLELALGARIPAVSLELAGVAYLPENMTVAGTAVGGRFTLFSIAGRVCPRIVRGAVELFVCAGGSFDRLSAQGFGVSSPGSASTSLGTVSLGPGMEFRLTHALRLLAGVEADYTPGRARFVLDNIGQVHTASQLGGSARLELAWYL